MKEIQISHISTKKINNNNVLCSTVLSFWKSAVVDSRETRTKSAVT